MVREYIGARYVPKFMGVYDPSQVYEALCVVDNGMGTSYITKIPTPAGTPLTNTTYWAIYGASSGAIIDLQEQIDAIKAGTLIIYDTVADMIADEDLNIGFTAMTLGYHTTGDGGEAIYSVVASTSRLHESLNNGYAAELQYGSSINVLQLGAYGNDTNDDTAIFKRAIQNADHIIVPRGNDKTYLISENLTLGTKQSLTGDYELPEAPYPALHFTTGGLIINGRNVLVKNLSIRSNGVSDGIKFGNTSGQSYPHCTLRNIYINNANYGVTNLSGVNVWMLLLENVRCSNCVRGFFFDDCGPSLTFINCYAEQCSENPFRMNNTMFNCISCNFGFINGSDIIITGSRGIFSVTNFECDETISNVMIKANGREIKFDGCKFGVNGTSGCCVFSTSSSLWACILENCQIGYQGASAGDGYKPPLVDIDNFSGYKYGCFVIGHGCANLPRFTPYIAQKPYLLDLDNNDVIHFYGTTIDLTKLVAGTVLYSNDLNKLCYFNGTNVVTCDGSIII